MRTAIVADDEPIIRLDLCDMLDNIGFKVVGEVSDGFDAVELCSRLKPDVVLMDIKMPLFDGLSAAKKIIDESLAGCVILVTAFCDNDFLESAKEIGVTGYLVKPIEERLLLPTVEIALSQSKRLMETKKSVQEAENKLQEKNLIDKAKMMIAKKEKISEGDAYSELQKFSMDKRISMGKAAKVVIEMNEDKTITTAKKLIANKYKISEDMAFKRIKKLSIDKKIDISQAAKEIIKQLSIAQEVN